MQSTSLRFIALCLGLMICAAGAAYAQPACPSPKIVSAADVPCTVTFAWVSSNNDPPTEIETIKVEPGDEVGTNRPRGATDIVVKTADGTTVTILPGDCPKSAVTVKISEKCCVTICFDWWTCTINITKAEC